MQLTLPGPRSRQRGVMRILYTALILPLILLGLSQTALPPAPLRLPHPAIATATSRDQAWRGDLRYMASELRRLHANAFFSTSRAEFDAAVSALDANIPTMTDSEIVIEMMRLVAMLGDGHTQIFDYSGAGGFRTYPIRLQWFGEHLYIVAASPDYAGFIGMRVARIGSMSAADAYHAVTPLISHYNDYGLRRKSPRLMVTPEVLYTLGIIDAMEHGTFTLVDDSGSEYQLELSPVALDDPTIEYMSFANINGGVAETPLYLQHSDANYWYSYLPDSQTIYFQYNAAHDMDSQSFDAFAAEVFAFIDANDVQRIVVDLRFNSGGYPALFKPFLRGLQDRPQLTRAGSLTVIIGNATFSSGMWHALDLRKMGGTLIGEPTSGKPNSYGHVRRITLPNTGIGIQYSTWYWTLIQGDDPAAVMPDVVIEPTIRDYLAGRDVVLESVLAEAANTP
jgi:hypothetical protein